MRKWYFYLAVFMMMIILSSRDNKEFKSEDNISSEQFNTEEQYDFEALVDMPIDELRYKRNEIYARQGRKFNSKGLQDYFMQFDWYKPRYDNVHEMLSDQDRKNIQKIIKAENLLKSQIIYADNAFEGISDQGFSVIKMHKFGGVYHLPVSINGTELFFIFDTGSSTISISSTVAIFLFRNGKLLPGDIIGEQDFIDAKGEVSTGTIVNLKEVGIGDYLLTNVQASVVDNLEAPLLLGQSALSRFANVEVDYSNETLKIKR